MIEWNIIEEVKPLLLMYLEPSKPHDLKLSPHFLTSWQKDISFNPFLDLSSPTFKILPDNMLYQIFCLLSQNLDFSTYFELFLYLFLTNSYCDNSYFKNFDNFILHFFTENFDYCISILCFSKLRHYVIYKF